MCVYFVWFDVLRFACVSYISFLCHHVGKSLLSRSKTSKDLRSYASIYMQQQANKQSADATGEVTPKPTWTTPRCRSSRAIELTNAIQSRWRISEYASNLLLKFLSVITQIEMIVVLVDGCGSSRFFNDHWMHLLL